MTRISSTFFLAALAISCSGAGPDDSFYLRFDPLLSPDTQRFIGEFRVALFKDRIFSTGRTGTGEMLATTVREMDVTWMTPLGDTAFALRQGKLVKSSDGDTFTEIAGTNTFDQLGGVDDTLYAMKRKSFGVSEVFMSKDGGVTWTQLVDIDAGTTQGTGESRSISRGFNGKVLLSVGVSDDTFGNVNYAGQSYEFTAATNEFRLVGSTTQKVLAPPWPDYVSKEGITFFQDPNDAIDQQADATNVKVLFTPPSSPDLKTARRLRWARPMLPFDATASMVVLGQDSEGRLLISAGAIYRSKAPLKLDDEKALVLKGPGCETRHSFTPDLANDDSVDVSLENKTGLRVMLRQLDNQLRWQRLKELDVGEQVKIRSLSNNAAKQNVRLMVSDPADETCLGVYVVSMAKESTIVANKP